MIFTSGLARACIILLQCIFIFGIMFAESISKNSISSFSSKRLMASARISAVSIPFDDSSNDILNEDNMNNMELKEDEHNVMNMSARVAHTAARGALAAASSSMAPCGTLLRAAATSLLVIACSASSVASSMASISSISSRGTIVNTTPIPASSDPILPPITRVASIVNATPITASSDLILLPITRVDSIVNDTPMPASSDPILPPITRVASINATPIPASYISLQIYLTHSIDLHSSIAPIAPARMDNITDDRVIILQAVAASSKSSVGVPQALYQSMSNICCTLPRLRSSKSPPADNICALQAGTFHALEADTFHILHTLYSSDSTSAAKNRGVLYGGIDLQRSTLLSPVTATSTVAPIRLDNNNNNDALSTVAKAATVHQTHLYDDHNNALSTAATAVPHTHLNDNNNERGGEHDAWSIAAIAAIATI